MPDLKFTWNHYFLEVIYQFRNTLNQRLCLIFDKLGFIVPLMGGNIDIVPLAQSSSPSSQSAAGQVIMISRASALRAGMRFLTRGIDDMGGVANEVETEMIVTNEYTFSFVQLRGSVPVFWEQTGFQIGAHKIHLTRLPQAAYPAAKLHFQDILERYKSIHILNLLKTVPDTNGNGNGVYSATPSGRGSNTPLIAGGEADLGKAYETQIKMLNLPPNLLQ